MSTALIAVARTHPAWAADCRTWEPMFRQWGAQKQAAMADQLRQTTCGGCTANGLCQEYKLKLREDAAVAV